MLAISPSFLTRILSPETDAAAGGAGSSGGAADSSSEALASASPGDIALSVLAGNAAEGNDSPPTTTTFETTEDRTGELTHDELVEFLMNAPDGGADPGSVQGGDNNQDSATAEDGDGPTDGDDQEPSTAEGAETDDDADDVNAGDDGGGDDEEEGDATADGDIPDSLKKRFDALTGMREKFKAQRDDARKRIDELEAELASRPEVPPVILKAPDANPLNDLQTPDAIRQRMEQADLVIDWARRHPEGGEIPTGQGDETRWVSAEEVSQRRLEAEKVKEIHGPKRLDYLARHREAQSAAREVYPDLFDANSTLSRHADEFLAAFPGLTQDPNYPLYVGDWVIGAMARHGHLKVVPIKAAESQPARGSAAAPAKGSASPGSAAPPAAKASASTSSASVSPPPAVAAPVSTRGGVSGTRKPTRVASDQALEAYAASGGDDQDALAAYLAKRVA